MLPTGTDNGGRLAAILPTGLAALAQARGHRAESVLHDATCVAPDHARCTMSAEETPFAEASAFIPALDALVIIAVDGLGSANLKARSGHAPTLSALPHRRISTVAPSTTAAALTTLTTGQLPALHGLVGYRIRHPKLGLISPLRDWTDIGETRDWQRAVPLFSRAADLGLAPRAYGRPAHAESGLTRAILSGATYVSGATIGDRLGAARRDIESGATALAYVYVDELDRAGHQRGWESREWSARLEQLDEAFADFMTGLPSSTGVVVTADHGMVDVLAHQHVVFDLAEPEFQAVREIGGEPRFRTFYLHDGAESDAFAAYLDSREGRRAWVGTREDASKAGIFGARPDDAVLQRIGDVVLAARGQCAYYSSDDDPQALAMVGQHGSLTDEERGIPLILGGALAGTSFARAVELVAGARSERG